MNVFFLLVIFFTKVFSIGTEYEGVTYNESNILNLVKKILPNNPNILEAGANCGEDTVNLCQVWPNANIFSFEPLLMSYDKLIKKVSNFSNVKCFPYALNNFTGKTNFYLCFHNAASSLLKPNSILDPHMSFQKETIEVDCIILDDWASSNNISKIDFMSLDMEGAELMVLKSSPKIMSTVKAIYTEVNYQEFRDGNCFYEEVKIFLEEQGFEEVWNHSWQLDGQEWQGNVLYIRR